MGIDGTEGGRVAITLVDERSELERAAGIELTALGAAATAPLDDLLDAAAAAGSADRIARGEARTLPDPPERREGRTVAIWI